MNKKYIDYLICIKCNSNLEYQNIIEKGDKVISGTLTCVNCSSNYPIINYIPRFVPMTNYADSFGMQWNIHHSDQHDKFSSVNSSEERFKNETKWGESLKGEVIIEAGCGAGRFTQFAANTGAMVLSFDYSSAVEASYQHHSDKENVLIVQADIYNMPFKNDIADKIYCFGVLQHTPDSREALKSLTTKLKSEGKIAADNYPFLSTTWFHTKYWVRPITKRLNHKLLYWWCKQHVKIMWPIFKLNRKLFSAKRANRINWRLLVPDYTSTGLSQDKLKQWAVMDLFDMLSPMYDNPVRIETFKRWFEELGYKDIDVHMGYNGCEGRGIKI
ncbi:class I SAM-dependent methyltransferase [Sulfurimonas sp.]|uniref:class I SAM-dependent methyltransferase n=1 Tax=Sulfurimonas sp. TaxID=2022749 RepID=UPI002AB22F72|nr:class I SAM-dependent methyltransferase [Sulfurimonas sp.]